MGKKSLLSGIIIVFFFTVVSKILSFLIELVIAYKFGATDETDIYYLVFGIIQILTPMITIGIWKVFMPAYKEFQINGGMESAKRLTDEMLTVFTSICLIFVGGLELFPALAIKIFAPGFSGAILDYTILILRIMSPMIVFVVMAIFHSAILQANSDFAKLQIRYVFQYLPVLLCLVFFSKRLSISVLSFSWVIGEAFAFIMAAFFTRKEYKFSFPKNNISKETKDVLKLVPAACLNSIINQINHIVDKAFGSILSTGSLTYLTYGNKIVGLFDGIVTTAFSTAFFPHLVELNAQNDEKGLKNFWSQYIMIFLSILVPVTFIMSFYSKVIVKIIYGHGQFNEYSVERTSVVLFIYSIGLIAMGMNTLFNDVFYIKKKTNMLVVTNIINIIVNFILDILLVKRYEIVGLCLATTISLYITLVIKGVCIRGQFSFNKETLKQMLVLIVGCLFGIAVPIMIRTGHFLDGYNEAIVGVLSFAIIYGIILFRPNTIYYKMISKYIFKKKEV